MRLQADVPKVNIPPEPPLAAFEWMINSPLSQATHRPLHLHLPQQGDSSVFRLPSTKTKLKNLGATILVQPPPPRGEIYGSSAGHGKNRNGLRVSDNNDQPAAFVRDKRGKEAGECTPSSRHINTFASLSLRISNQNEARFSQIPGRHDTKAVGFG